MKFELSNAPASQSFPMLRYQYIMNEPFVNGSASLNQWSHQQIAYKRQRDLQPGYKLN